MTRVFAFSLTATVIALWAVSAKSSDYSSAVWPHYGHEPAITKTLRYGPPAHMPPPAPEFGYDWQNQAPLPPPSFGGPRFSHPQQGYYPREGTIQQAPGYEYGSGGVGTYPPLYPMEGANWREPRVPVMKNSHSNGTFAECHR